MYMLFRLSRTPKTFQRLMNRVIRGLEYNIALAYLDDDIVYGPSLDQCVDTLLVVFGLLKANVKLKGKKCVLFATEANYLGCIITSESVKTDSK